MIVNAILNFFYTAAQTIIGWLPDSSVLSFTPADVSYVLSLLSNVACIVPTDTLLQLVAVWFLISQIDLGTAFANWIIRKIPGIS